MGDSLAFIARYLMTVIVSISAGVEQLTPKYTTSNTIAGICLIVGSVIGIHVIPANGTSKTTGNGAPASEGGDNGNSGNRASHSPLAP